jgi:chromosome segregation ATPase
MFNFTIKDHAALIESNGQCAVIIEKYNAAIKKIKRLECELHQKAHELTQSNEAQSVLRQGVKKCTVTLRSTQEKLQTIAEHLELSKNYIFELSQENRYLKSSGDEWLNRAIKLEFDVLMLKDKLTKIEMERDLAVTQCEQLQVELMSANKGNSRGRN